MFSFLWNTISWLILTKETHAVQKRDMTPRICKAERSGESRWLLLPRQDSYKASHGRPVQQGCHVAKLAQERCGLACSANSEYLQDVHWTLTVRIRRKTWRWHNWKQNEKSLWTNTELPKCPLLGSWYKKSWHNSSWKHYMAIKNHTW